MGNISAADIMPGNIDDLNRDELLRLIEKCCDAVNQSNDTIDRGNSVVIDMEKKLLASKRTIEDYKNLIGEVATHTSALRKVVYSEWFKTAIERSIRLMKIADMDLPVKIEKILLENKINKLSQLRRLTYNDLLKIKGIGERRALLIFDEMDTIERYKRKR